jgi:hypothetical protein
MYLCTYYVLFHLHQRAADRLLSIGSTALSPAEQTLRVLGKQIESNEMKFTKLVARAQAMLCEFNGTMSSPADYWNSATAASGQLQGLVGSLPDIGIGSIALGGGGGIGGIGAGAAGAVDKLFNSVSSGSSGSSGSSSGGDQFEAVGDGLRCLAPVADIGYDLLTHFFRYA